MSDVTRSSTTQPDWHENAFDLTRGIAAYTGSRLVAGLARVVGRHPDAAIANAFNHKQVASKLWARDRLFDTLGGRFEKVWILGGWYGVFAAMLFDDPRFDIGLVESYDLDDRVAAVASTLNADTGARFRALTGDMYDLDYRGGGPDLVVNTSCEHIADVRGWLDGLAAGTRVLLQSNDYFSEPTHINCVPSVEAFADLARLARVDFAGTLPTRKYNRFMLIGAV
ncbi:MAG: class I SAM-dependent methyltransferase [Rhizobiales bacterium]|nr:class I SAM-dependent methyltransferase [Hyphomicrobiales bacterium]